MDRVLVAVGDRVGWSTWVFGVVRGFWGLLLEIGRRVFGVFRWQWGGLFGGTGNNVFGWVMRVCDD